MPQDHNQQGPKAAQDRTRTHTRNQKHDQKQQENQHKPQPKAHQQPHQQPQPQPHPQQHPQSPPHAQPQQHDDKQQGRNPPDRSPKPETHAPAVDQAVGTSSPTTRHDAVQPPANPSPTTPPAYASTEAQAPPDIAAQPTLNFPAVESEPLRSEANIAVVAAAVLGGVVLVFALLSLVAYNCSHRKKAATQSKNAKEKPMDYSGLIPTSRTNLTDSANESKYPSFRPYDQQQKQWPYLQRDRSQTWSTQEHVNVSMSSQSSHGTTCEQTSDPKTKRMDQPEQLGDIDALQSEASNHRKQPGMLRMPSLHETETTVEVDDMQIDRCLSYYMKRRTCASVHPENISGSPSPMQQDMDVPPSPNQAADTSVRKSIKFTKTANLLEKVRRSQMRLNEEALSKAKSEGYRFSTVPFQRNAQAQELPSSPASSAGSTVTTKFDNSTSVATPTRRSEGAKLPAHWRDSSNLRLQDARNPSLARGEPDMLKSSQGMSEPHSAFEYADYYDKGLPGAGHTSVRLELTASEAEDGSVLPWRNHSPCRSSALSPRGSTTTSMRQRSGTPSQTSPMAWSEGVGSEGFAQAYGAVASRGATKGHLSTVSDAHRDSAVADEVIRF